MGWRLLDTGSRSAAANMELDSALLMDLKDERDAILHLYDWERDAATFGHFIEPENFLNLEGVKKNNLDLARRPTGGGIIFHNCDLAFSILIPASSPWFSQNPLDNYAFINNRVIWALDQVMGAEAELLPVEPTAIDPHCRSFCMAKPTKYDVMIQGKKIGGAAQRKTRFGFLHQGSISIGFPPEYYLQEVLSGGIQVIDAMRQNSFALLGQSWGAKELLEARLHIRKLLEKAFSETYEG
jgi:lipoate-protein ligase A